MRFGKWHALTIGILVLIVAGLIYLTSEERSQTSGPEVVVREILAPLQGGVSLASSWVTGAVETLRSLPRLVEENRRLRREVAVLESALQATITLKRENEQLRGMLGLEPYLPPRRVTARVIARSPEQWFSTVTLNRGSRAGLAPGQAVVTTSGVVGHVESVTPNTARVILLVDPKSAIGGMIESTGSPVLVEGSGDPSGRTAVVHPLVRDAELEPGARIVTSGLSHIFPKGVPIGVIESVSVDAAGVRRIGVLRPFVDLGRIEWVSVILESGGEVHWPELGEIGAGEAAGETLRGASP